MARTDTINILKRAKNVTVAQQQIGYSKVRIHVGTDENNNEIVYEAGNDSGSVLEINNPFGTIEMAENILSEIAGMQYQPGKAEGALIDPAAELGDSISANNTYFGMYIRATTFGRLMESVAEAPTDQEIEHEFGVEGSEEREYIRYTKQVRAELKTQATEIAAKVSVEDRNMTSGFGWSLTRTKWRVGKYNGNTLDPVLTIDENGLSVVGSGTFTGTINASAGTIGGIIIKKNSIESSNGNFKIGSDGKLTATEGKFLGKIYASNILSNPNNGEGGTLPGNAITSASLPGGCIVPNGITTSQTSAGINGSLGFADLFGNSIDSKSGIYPAYFFATSINASSFFSGSYLVDAQGGGWDLVGHKHALTVDSNGNVSCGPARSGSITGGNFNIADTAFFKNAVSAAAATAADVTVTIASEINANGKSFKITARAKSGNKTLATKTANTSNAAYLNGQGSVEVNESHGSYDIWISNWGMHNTLGYWVEISVNLTNGSSYTSGRLYLDQS